MSRSANYELAKELNQLLDEAQGVQSNPMIGGGRKKKSITPVGYGIQSMPSPFGYGMYGGCPMPAMGMGYIAGGGKPRKYPRLSKGCQSEISARQKMAAKTAKPNEWTKYITANYYHHNKQFTMKQLMTDPTIKQFYEDNIKVRH